MTTLTAFESLYDPQPDAGVAMPLPPDLGGIYGSLRFPSHSDRPYRIANFVETLDGVVSLGIPGMAGGGEISGFNQHDRMLMGMLRAAADAVIVGAGTLRALPNHLWTPAYAFPDFSASYQALRNVLGKLEPPLSVIVSARAEIDLGLQVFQSGEAPVLIVTTDDGWEHLRKQALPPSVRVAVKSASDGQISARLILEACVSRLPRSEMILIEGGPRLISNFFAEKSLDELFMTISPQVAGRDGLRERPGLVAGKMFAPEEQVWGALAGVKRAGSHLFLRYRFNESIA